MATVYSSARLQWKGDTLRLDGKGAPLMRIVPDAKWEGMWRVQWPDGSLTDMLNKTRVKDAAISLALQPLNKIKEAAE
jgi:hypothetical protein